MKKKRTPGGGLRQSKGGMREPIREGDVPTGAPSAERIHGLFKWTRGSRGSWRYWRGGGGPGPDLKVICNTFPVGSQPICYRIASSQKGICVGVGRSPGVADRVITFYLVEKGVNAGNYVLVRFLVELSG